MELGLSIDRARQTDEDASIDRRLVLWVAGLPSTKGLRQQPAAAGVACRGQGIRGWSATPFLSTRPHRNVGAVERQDLELRGVKLPDFLVVERSDVDAARDEHVAAPGGDRLQRPLDAVKDLRHQTRAQLHRQRLARPVDVVSDRQPGRVFVHLPAGRGKIGGTVAWPRVPSHAFTESLAKHRPYGRL
jgi:hypothetical protein